MLGIVFYSKKVMSRQLTTSKYKLIKLGSFWWRIWGLGCSKEKERNATKKIKTAKR